jgi:hypothetical protein
MDCDMDIRALLIYLKQCYGRSMGYFGYITQYLIITANIKLFETYINSTGLSTAQAILISFPIFIIGNLVIGHIDLMYGIWKGENDFTWEVTPMAKNLCERAERMEKQLKRVEKELKIEDDDDGRS